ncbi:MAG: hypothetical protein ACI9G1_003784 [Pirellulaceae bacterium]|jgi:hypothetical protein
MNANTDYNPALDPTRFEMPSLRLAMPSWLVSLLVHVVMLVVLGVVTFGPKMSEIKRILTVGSTEPEDPLEPIPAAVEPTIDFTISSDPILPNPAVIAAAATDFAAPAISADDIDDIDDSIGAIVAQTTINIGGGSTAAIDRRIGKITGTGSRDRGRASRKLVSLKNGATPGSEEAVGLALRWLAEHQLPDGSWSFDHRHGKCQGRCSNHGKLEDSRNGATGLALLTFLGTGKTHVEGEYKTVIRQGLQYLVKNMKSDGGLHESGGRMYSHGICAIVLSESYAMTHDRKLMAPAQASINYIVASQDPVGGGWRYNPQDAGDTSVFGWQLMALKSAHMAYLEVPPDTIRKAMKFLESVQADSGAAYGYTAPGKGIGTTAVGLLSRMYLGWKHDNPALKTGIESLSDSGPTKNMYYNYYATQLMRHYDGPLWKKWNDVMRDQLVNSQIKDGHAKGSWFIEGGDHGSGPGGRHYSTCMSAMVLEVYYRHMPIIGTTAVEEDFPL